MIKKVISKVQQFFYSRSYTTQDLIQIHGGKIGKGVFIGQEVLIDYDYCFLLEIGDGAVISARTIIEFHDSCLPNVLGEAKAKIGRVKIGKRSYIGVNTVILPGVKIGDSAIVGACSLVIRDIPTEEVWGGIPARYICTVNELDHKRQSSKSTDVAHLNWIGELEKEKINYPEFKKEFIQKVRLTFQTASNRKEADS